MLFNRGVLVAAARTGCRAPECAKGLFWGCPTIWLVSCTVGDARARFLPELCTSQAVGAKAASPPTAPPLRLPATLDLKSQSRRCYTSNNQTGKEIGLDGSSPIAQRDRSDRAGWSLLGFGTFVVSGPNRSRSIGQPCAMCSKINQYSGPEHP